MTTITLEVPEELATAITKRGNAFAVAVLADAIYDEEWSGISPDSDAETAAWWAGLSEEQRKIEVAALQKRLDAAGTGRSFTAEEVVARIRSRHSPQQDAR